MKTDNTLLLLATAAYFLSHQSAPAKLTAADAQRAISFLEAKGVSPEIIAYLKTHPAALKEYLTTGKLPTVAKTAGQPNALAAALKAIKDMLGAAQKAKSKGMSGGGGGGGRSNGGKAIPAGEPGATEDTDREYKLAAEMFTNGELTAAEFERIITEGSTIGEELQARAEQDAFEEAWNNEVEDAEWMRQMEEEMSLPPDDGTGEDLPPDPDDGQVDLPSPDDGSDTIPPDEWAAWDESEWANSNWSDDFANTWADDFTSGGDSWQDTDFAPGWDSGFDYPVDGFAAAPRLTQVRNPAVFGNPIALAGIGLVEAVLVAYIAYLATRPARTKG